jgi:ubiquinone/menaquinone biosynthesis C-methylase UbiE
MDYKYVHGYSDKESSRLLDQATCLDDLLHHDSIFPANSKILEAGCGTGAQTRIIAIKSPESKFISMDISKTSLSSAKIMIDSLDIKNVEFLHGDIFDLKFPDEYFDHIFICFVLEHLHDPVAALNLLKIKLKTGGSITIIEGDHGSTFFFPESKYALKAINAQVKLQSAAGGNALIGRELYPLLTKAGFKNCLVSPRMVYVDSDKPNLVEGFTKKTFISMIEGIKKKAIAAGILSGSDIDQGIEDLYKTTLSNGVFCYTFFKGTGIK